MLCAAKNGWKRTDKTKDLKAAKHDGVTGPDLNFSWINDEEIDVGPLGGKKIPWIQFWKLSGISSHYREKKQQQICPAGKYPPVG